MEKIYRSPFGCSSYTSFKYKATYSNGNKHKGLDRKPDGDPNSSYDKLTDQQKLNRRLFSPCFGKVFSARNNTGGFGNFICIVPTDSDGNIISDENHPNIILGHMEDLPQKEDGTIIHRDDLIFPGMQIGIMGSTGNSSAPHLHIETSIIGNLFDKYSYDGGYYNDYCKEEFLVDPNDYFDFDSYEYSELSTTVYTGAELIELIFKNRYNQCTEGDFDMAKTWTNDSGKDLYIFPSISDCWADMKTRSNGIITKGTVCDCFGVIDGCYLVLYQPTGSINKICGFTKYFGGIDVPVIE